MPDPHTHPAGRFVVEWLLAGRWIELGTYDDWATAQVEAEQHSEHYGGETIVTERRVTWFSGSGSYLSAASTPKQESGA